MIFSFKYDVLGIKREVALGTQRWKGAYVRAKLPRTTHLLPENIFDLLHDVVDYAALRSDTIWNLGKQTSEQTFTEDEERFTEIVHGNKGLYHLLLGVFYTKMNAELERRIPNSHARQRNRFLTGAMAQRELTQAYLMLFAYEIHAIDTWLEVHLNDHHDRDRWRSVRHGALSMARAVYVFLEMGSFVSFPNAYIDIQWHIDLLVRLPGCAAGLCVQLKARRRQKVPVYHLLTDENIEKFKVNDEDQILLDGMSQFRQFNSGNWLAVSIQMGQMQEDESPISPSSFTRQVFHNLLKDVKALEKTE